jgi:iron complex outermembrane receptor protein
LRKYTYKKSALLASTFLMSGVLTISGAQAQDAANSGTEVITVTATKRTSDLQDVPMSLNVLGNQQMEDLNINAFDDYIHFLPTVSFESPGPGNGNLYMRGIASGGDGNHSGSMPSVGVYLDEQPITTINNILDLHMYDIARIETLSGPQGTLFGSSSQSGTLRIITNKPVIGEFQAGYDVAGNIVKDGEIGGTLEAFANFPIADNAAIRLVGWHEEDGGYIDNVPHTINFAASGISINNAALVEENYNNTSTTGGRALLALDLNENWLVTPGIIYQKQDSNGTYTHNPSLFGDLNTASFNPQSYDDNWYQATLTVEGNIAGLDVVYAGAYLDRHLVSENDYVGYSEYLEEVYAGSGYSCLYYNADGVTCANPNQLTTGDEFFIRQSHEFRVTTPSENRLRAIGGLFYQKQKHDFDLQWIVPDSDSAGSVIENGHTVWQTKQVREDRDWAAFGELEFDVTDRLTVMGGARFYKYRNSLYGFNGFLRHCTGFTVNGEFTEDPAGTPQYPCFNTRILDDEQKNNGEVFKVNASYTIDDDKLVYATFSQGFRPGGVNRARVPGIPKYVEDNIDNYEFGWKTSWADNRVRFNGSLYYLKWSDVQFAFLDFAVSNLTIIQNVGGSRTYGAEFDLTVDATDDLRLSFSASYNDAKLTDEYRRSATGPLLAPIGSRMPFVPKIQLTAVARQNVQLGELPGFIQGSLTHRGSSFSDLDTTNTNRNQDAYTLINLAAGIEKDNMTFSIFVENLLDTRATVAIYDPGYDSALDQSQATNRPRTIGFRFGQRF